MSTWTGSITRGFGSYDFRLEVEGWPDEWTTNSAITHSSGADGRSIYPGLKYEGIEIAERAVLQEASLDVRGITFQIVSTGHGDDAMASLSRQVDPVFWLNTSATEATTTLSLKGSQNLSTGTHYHIATEAIESTSGNTVTRGVWGTTAQVHNTSIDALTTISAAQKSVPIYDYPPTMMGRRAFLYAYGSGDSKTGNGTVIWRGVVGAPPRLHDDGVTWLIDVEPITSVLKQPVPPLNTLARIVGIYHSNECSFYMRVTVNTLTNYAEGRVTGFHLTEDDFVEAVNNALATILGSVDASNTYIDSVTYMPQGVDTATPYFRFRTSGTAPAHIIVEGGSPMEGWASPVRSGTFRSSDGVKIETDATAINTDYIVPLLPLTTNVVNHNGIHGVFMNPVEYPRACLGPGQLMPSDFIADAIRDISDTTNSPWTLYLDADLGTNVTALTVSNDPGSQPRAPGNTYTVESTATVNGVWTATVAPDFSVGDFKYKNGSFSHVSFNGFVAGGTEIKPGRIFGGTTTTPATDMAGFLTDSTTGIVGQAKDANDGTVPYVLGSAAFNNGDVGTWTVQGAQPIPVKNRKYVFSAPKELLEVLQEECKLARHFMHLDSQGRIAASPLPFVTGTQLAATTIDTSKILTPAGDMGKWEGWEPQRDGLINRMQLKQGYDPFEDEWSGIPYDIRDIASIAEHKNRGQGTIEIAPFSQVASERGSGLEDYQAAQIASEIFAFFARDYAVVTVQVGFSLFNTLVGDVVLLTSPRIPNGDGTRGVTNKRATVIERRWNMDPADFRGELTLLVQQDNGGYTPTARVTGQSNLSGNQWDLTIAASNVYNQAWRQSSAYTVVDHFAAGQYVRIVKWDDVSDTQVTGTIDSIPDNQSIVVTFDGTWTPSTDTWNLEWQVDTGGAATTGQRAYTYVADTGLKLADGTGARRFS